MRVQKLLVVSLLSVICTSTVFGAIRARSVRQIHAPAANSDAVEVHRGGTISVPAPGVLVNDTAPNSASVVLVSGPAHGTLTLSATGAFTYHHDGSSGGLDAFSYRISSSSFMSNVAVVSIRVTDAAIPVPVARADHYAVVSGGTLHIVDPGVLTNDSDSQGTSLFAAVATNPTHGTLTLNADGSFTYINNGTGPSDSFTYTATNGATTSAPAIVTINITAVNAAPVGVADSLTVARGGLAQANVLANDTDAEGSALSAQMATTPAHGTAILSADGSLIYQHDGSATTSDSFTYRASDGQTTSAPVTVTITVVNTAPVASGDAYAVSKGGTLTVGAPGVIGNDFDANGDALHASVVSAPTHGTLTLSSNGSFTYTHDGGSSSTDSFTYKVNDGLADSNVATVMITVPATVQPPVVQNDLYVATRGATLNVAAPGVLANDSDPQHNPLSASLVSGPSHGSVTLNADGSFSYVNNNDTATSDSFIYRASNGFSTPVQATVTLTIKATNQPPVANADLYSVSRGQSLAGNVLANDSDPEGAALTAHLIAGPFHGLLTLDADGSFLYLNDGSLASTDSFTYAANDGQTDSPAATVTINVVAAVPPPAATGDHYSVLRGATLNVAAPGVLGNDSNASSTVLIATTAHGALTLNDDGSFSYVNDGSSATTDSFQYAASNGTTQSPAVTVTIDINAVATPPTANGDSYSVARSGTLDVPPPGVLSNDTANVTGATLTATSVTAPAHGTLTVAADGSFVYHNDGSSASSDSFTYKADNGQAQSSPATAAISITATNQPPIASADTYTIPQGGTLTITPPGVLANDSDPEGSTLNAIQVSAPSHGAITLNANGSFTYTNDGLSASSDSFTYKANDGQADSNVVTVTINVTPVNHAPVANDDAYSVNQDTPLTLAAPGVLANDTDADGDALTAALLANVTHGTLALNSNGSFTYTPNPGYFGTDTFTYKVNDGHIDSNTATVTISIAQVVPNNHAPVAANDSYSTNEDALFSSPTSVLANDTDADGDPLHAVLVTNPANGAITFNSNGTFVYQPAPDFYGTDTFTYKANDTKADSNIATVTITVNPINDTPSFLKGADQTVNEDAGPQTRLGWATSITAGPNEGSQIVHFNIVGNTNPALFSAGPAVSSTGTLTFTPAPDANGSATITLNIQDDGGIVNGGIDTSANQTFVINVLSVNDVPSFTKGADQTVNEDAGGQTIASWATALSAGPANESGQTLNFIVANNNNALFSAQPAIAQNGTLTYTPAANQNGSATVTVQIHDNGGTANGGVDTSAAQTFLITVVAVNDVPSFTKGADQTVLEDAGAQTVANWATAISAGPNEAAQTVHFNIVGNTNAALFSGQPAVSSTGTLTYTPAANANGSATITLNIQDNGGTANGGVDTSATQTFVINVTAVNDAPAFTKGADETVNEDTGLHTVAGWATAISPGPADEAGQALNFIVTNDNNALFSVQPAIAANGTLTYTLAANQNGVATVSVQIHDNGGTANGGVDTSVAQTFLITVNGVNDPPVNAVPGIQTTLEDTPIIFTTISIADIDAGSGQLQTTLTATNGLINGQPTLTFTGTMSAINTALNGVTFTPNPDFNGAASLSITTNDQGNTGSGGPLTDTDTITINVTAVNDAPSFTKGANQTVLEDAGAQTVAGWATAISAGPADESGQALSFIVSNNNNALFSAQPAIAANGTLTYMPAPNANGSATVTVQIHDNGGTANGGVDTSATQTFTITVTAVNDVPSFTAGANQTVLEDAGPQTVGGWATAISVGPANEAGQVVHFNITNNTNPTLFSVAPAVAANGTLTYTPAADANGSATITLDIQDDGGTLNGGVDTSATQTFVINVTPVNDVPSFTKGADQTVLEDAGLQSVSNWATAISTGPANESSQTVNFLVSNDNNALFSVQPVVAANGTLTYTPAANANGTANVSVQIQDNGGTANGGVDTSAAQTFVITVTAVNDAPAFTKGADQTVLEDAGPQSVNGWATSISAGPANESGQTVHFNITNNTNPALFIAAPSVAANGALTYTTAPNANGSATITLDIQDNGGTLNGGTDTSATQTFVINVTPVNDAPSFTAGSNVTVNEDAAAYSAVWASNMSPGPADESGQTLTFFTSNNNSALFIATPSVAADGTLTFSLQPNAHGSATVNVYLQDNGGTANGGIDTSPTATFTITVNSVNDAPSFTKGADQTANEDAGPQTVNGWATSISAGPPDEAGQTVTFQVANDNNALFSAQPAISPTGTLTYTTAPDANGSATVTVTLKDNGGTANGGVDTSAPQTFTITINPVNDPPTFTGGGDVTVNEDSGAYSAPWASAISPGPADESAQTVTFNVTNNTNSAMFSAQPAISPAGVLTFTPAPNANGTAQITITLSDNGGGANTSAPLTFNINVTAVNDPPVAVNDVYSVNEGATLSASTVLANDTDIESDPLTAIIVTTPSHGSITFNANGTFTYIHDGTDTGNDSFTYKANDGQADSNVATVAINVTPINDPPVANSETYAVNKGGTLTTTAASGVLANDTDEESNALTAVLGTTTTHGTLTLNPNGSFTYMHNGDTATSDSFTYKANDGTSNSNTVTVTISIVQINTAPVANNDSYTVASGQTLNGASVLTNDTDAEGSPLTAILVATTPNGTLNLNANGTFTYTPTGAFTGADTFTYKANDGQLDSNVATVTINVVASNQAPTANADSYHVARGGTLTIPAPGVLGNDTDPEASPLTANLVSSVAHGALTLNANGSFTYINDGSLNATDSFTYRANDGQLNSGAATVTITITATNTAPVATADSYSTNEDTPLNVAAPGVLTNDTDADGDVLHAILVSNVSHGVLTLNANGSFNYVPTQNYNGSDSFTYKANDGALDSNTVTVSITVNAINDPPVAVNDSYNTVAVNTLNVAAPGVLANDTDVEGSTLSAALVTGPAHATTFTFNADGSFTYLHNPADNSATDTFTYKANDGLADSNVATVTINITYNIAPVVTTSGGSTTFTEDTSPAVIDSAVTVTDADNANLASATVTIANLLDLGLETLAANVSGTTITASYSAPTLTLSGSDTVAHYQQVLRTVTFSDASNTPNITARTINFVANDGIADSNTASKTVNVVATNDPPVAVDDSYSTAEDTPLVIAATGVLGNDSDPESSPITVSKVNGAGANVGVATSTTHGSVTLNANGSFTYTPAANYNGTDSFTYKANDGTVDSTTAATVTITITPVNDAPTITNAGNTLAYTENQAATAIEAAINVNDVDGGNLAGATVTISNNYASGEDTLAFTPLGSITGSFSAGVLTLSGSDTIANYQTALRSVTYQNSSDTPSTAARTITWSVSDGTLSGTATSTVNVTAVNDPPTVTLSGAAPAFTEDAGAIVVDGGVTVADVDSPNLTGATVQITNLLDAGSETLAAPTLVGGITASYVAPTLTLSGTTTLANYQTVLRAVTYNNASQNPTTTNRIVRFVANDGTNTSANADKTVTVTAVNDAPVLANVSTLNYTENNAATAINTVITVNDVDSANLVGATVQITTNYNSAQDVLSFTNALGITGSFNSATGTMTLTGSSSVANYQTALRSVKYNNTSDDPTTAARTVLFQADDGGSVNNLSNVITSTINVTAVNDPPTAFAFTSLPAQAGIPITYPASKLGGTDVEAGTTITIDTAPINLVNMGSVVINANGSFTATPLPGAAGGTASFQYRVSDNGNPGPGVNGAYVTVSFSVAGPAIYFVKSTGAGNCTLGNECNLTTALTNIGASTNATIFISDANSQTNNVTLNSGGSIIGQGVTAASFDALFSIGTPAQGVLAARPSVNQARPTVNGSVTLNASSAARGFNISASSGDALSASSRTGLVVSDMNVTTSTNNLANAAVNFASSSGTFSFGTITVSGSNASKGLNFSGTTSSSTVTATSVTSASGAAVTVASSGSTNFTIGTVTSTTGSAVNINTGTGAFTFTKISSNGGTKGITVSGLTGSFTVNGSGGLCDSTHISGSDCTGGTIQSASARGAEFISSNNITLNNMYFKSNSTTVAGGCNANVASGTNNSCNGPLFLQTIGGTTNGVVLNRVFIDGSAQMGIVAYGVSNFSMSNSEVENTGSVSGFEQSALDLQNLSGTGNVITGCHIHDNDWGHNIFITSNTGTATILFTNNVVDNVIIANPAQSDGFQSQGYGTANMTVNVNNSGGPCTFNKLFSNGVSIGASQSATVNGTLSNCSITKTSGVFFQGSGTSTMTGTITGNTITNKIPSDWTNSGNGSNGITIGKSSASQIATFTGIVTNNTITSAHCGGGCAGIAAGGYGNGTTTMTITGNNVQHVDQEGINFIMGQGSAAGTSNNVVTIQGNTVTNPDTSGNYAIEVTAGTQTGDHPCVVMNLGDMSVGHTVPANRNNVSNGTTGFKWVPTGGTAPSISAIGNYAAGVTGTLKLPNLTGGTNDAAAQAWIVASNTNASSDAFNGAAWVVGSTCP